MWIELLKAKIHRATVTGSDLNYLGSITIDSELLERSGILSSEKVSVLNINNGERFDTYMVKGKAGSGEVVLNGAAARLVQKGDKIIIVSYAMMTLEEAQTHVPKIVHVDEQNKPLSSEEISEEIR